MITQFGSLFAGHVDLDNEGLDGTPANDRWLSDENLATVFPKSEAIAKLMDRTGYDTFWLAEHHFQREGYECIPNILMLALHLCHITKHIKIGCGFNIAPMWHPLRMAEDYATADWLTGGRVIFGVGRGYHTREVEVFGAPLRDQDAKDRKSTRLNSSHGYISYAVFCLKKKKMRLTMGFATDPQLLVLRVHPGHPVPTVMSLALSGEVPGLPVAVEHRIFELTGSSP